MRLWQREQVWVWLVGLEAIETGRKLSRGAAARKIAWEEMVNWGFGAFSLPSTILSHPPHPAWAFLWRAQLILEKFLGQKQAPP